MFPEKMSRPGWGDWLEARFRPKLHWGAEFLADTVRLCAMAEVNGKVTVVHAFMGGFTDAEAFASLHGLAYEGFHASVSHLPFKLEPLDAHTGGAEGNEEDKSPYLERFRPRGLPRESFDAHFFSQADQRLLVLAREDALKAYRSVLPPSLQIPSSLGAGPLALLPFHDHPTSLGRWAAICSESHYTHLLFFRDGALIAYAKVFSGWEEARQDPSLFAREMKKALVYHYASRFPGASLETIQIWSGGPDGAVPSAMDTLRIPQVTPVWPEPLDSLAETQRVAGAHALQSLRGSESLFSFTLPYPEAAEARRLWLRRAGQLARAGSYLLGFLALGMILLLLSAAGMRWAVEAKTKTWSGELGKWDEFQKSRAAVEKEMQGMEGLLIRRTEAYAGMQGIARLLPPEVWLESWRIAAGPRQGLSHQLVGLSLSEERIPEFLNNLERSRKFAMVKLKSTERIKGETVEQKTGIPANHKDIVRFQIGVIQ